MQRSNTSFGTFSTDPLGGRTQAATAGILSKKAVLKNFAIFTGKHPKKSIKKRLQHRCFIFNITKLLRTTTLKNICERLLLEEFGKLRKWSGGTYFTTVHQIIEKVNIFKGSLLLLILKVNISVLIAILY